MDLKGCLGRLFFGPCMHIVVAEEPGILLTNSPGWDFMSEIGLARAGSNEVSRQHNKSNVWFYCFYQKCYFLALSHWLIDSWLMTHDSLTHLTHKTSILWQINLIPICGCTAAQTQRAWVWIPLRRQIWFGVHLQLQSYFIQYPTQDLFFLLSRGD